MTSHTARLIRTSKSAKALSISAATALAALGVSVVVPSRAAQAAPTTSGALTVTVFQDFNANGQRNTTEDAAFPALDKKVAGATVAAVCVTDSGADNTVGTVDDTQAVVSTTAQDGAGDYVLAAPGSPCRVEVTPPGTYQDGAAGVTQVAFVNTVPGSVSIGLNRPSEFCQDNPDVFVSCFTSHSYGAGNYRSIKTFPWYAMSDPDGNPTATWTNSGPGPDYLADSTGVLANQNQVGTVFGIAADVDNNRVFSSAFFKAGAIFGPGGTGAIYATDLGTNVITTFADLNAIYGAGTAGANNHAFASNAAARVDAAGKTDAGKVALGDLELSNDGTLLYVSNLANRHVYALPTAGPLTTGTITDIAPPARPANCPTVGDLRVMGLGETAEGIIHLGGVCTGESTGGNSDLHSYVWSLSGTAWTLVFDGGMPDDDTVYTPASPGQTALTQARYWRNGAACSIMFIIFIGEFVQCPGLTLPPQYSISDISFDGDNAMVLSYRDRQQDMITVPEADTGNFLPAGSTAQNATLRRVCRTSTAAPWIEESGLTCGGLTAGPEVPATNPSNDPAGDEFYWAERQGDGGWEAGNGGAVQLGGWPIIGTTTDPQTMNSNGNFINLNTGTGGVNAFDNRTGALRGALDVELNQNTGLGSSPANFGKINSMGDVDAMCDRAPVEIGNRLWVDTDKDGIQDPGEAPIAGATVLLFEDADNDGIPDGPAVGTATTDANGNYLFSSDARYTDVTGKDFGIAALEFDKSNVTSNRFVIEVPLTVTVGPDALGITWQDEAATNNPNNALATNDDWVDSDFNVANGLSPTVVITGAGKNDHRYDAGYANAAPKVGVGNYVWEDVNNNGIRDGAEAGIPSVSVSIFADADNNGVADGPALQATTTDANGNYLFEGLDPGLYFIETSIPTGYVSSDGLNGGALGSYEAPAVDPDTDATDSDDNGSTSGAIVRSRTFDLQIGAEPTGEPAMLLITPTLPDADVNLTVDFGFYRPVGVGNFVWIDANNNGQWDTGEAPYDGAFLSIFEDFNDDGAPDGPSFASTSTDALGHYAFNNLIPGTYIIEMNKPTGYVSSTGVNGSATGPFEGIATPDPDTTVNADTGSAGDDNGSNFGASWIRSKPITLTVGGETGDGDTDANFNPSVDFGIFRPARLGDLLWLDLDNNGQQDGGAELGVPNVTVTLHDAGTNAVIATTSTDASGNYLFDYLIPGSYYVVFDAADPDFPAQHTFTTQNSGADATDSDTNPISGQTGNYTLAAGDSNMTVDSGIYAPGPILSLGNLIWADYNNNGVVNSGEPGIGGVVVDLYADTDSDGAPDGPVLATQTTNAAGNYLFTGLAAGDYVVRINQTNWNSGGALAGWHSSSPASADPDDDVNNDDNGAGAAYAETTASAVTLAFGAEPTNDGDSSADSNLSVDFGFVPDLAELGDKVWYDTNRNGIQDGVELPVPNVTVRLFHAGDNPATATPVATDVTDAAGLYLFTGLIPGDYFVVFDATTLPAGWKLTTKDAGADNGIDSDADPITGVAAVTNLTAGESDLTWDAGIVTSATIGDFVWLDTNKNGVQDSGEQGFGNVTVKLINVATGAVVATTTTNASGYYLFTDVNPVTDALAPIQYRIDFVLPAGYSVSPRNVGGNATDSDADPSNGRTTTTTLDPNEDDRTWDMGIYVTPIDAKIVKTLDGTLKTGTVATYFLDVTNNGPIDTVFGLTVTDDLPAGLQYVSATGDGWSCSASGQKVTCTRTTSLAKGATTRIALQVMVVASGGASITNLASVTTVSDTEPANNESSTAAFIVEGTTATSTTTTSTPPTTNAPPAGKLPTTGSRVVQVAALLGSVFMILGMISVTSGRRTRKRYLS